MATENKTDEEIVGDLIGSLDDIPCINMGGCLFATYATYLKTKELGIKEVTIVQIDWSDGYFTNVNKKFLKGEVSSPVSGNHFVIRVGDKMFDSHGEQDYDYDENLILDKDEDIQKLCVTALRGNDWNDSFDRESGVQEIKKIMEIDLSHCL